MRYYHKTLQWNRLVNVLVKKMYKYKFQSTSNDKIQKEKVVKIFIRQQKLGLKQMRYT